jgi:hypothetical protein
MTRCTSKARKICGAARRITHDLRDFVALMGCEASLV